jgi:hypothetical protein
MTVTSENLINRRLATRVDSDIKELTKLFAAQQAAENRRKKTVTVKARRQRSITKIIRGA